MVSDSSSGNGSAASNISVGIRVRPSSSSDSTVFSTGRAQVLPESTVGDVKLAYYSDRNGGADGKVAAVDYMFDQSSSQADVYSTAAKRLVEAVPEGINVSILAVSQSYPIAFSHIKHIFPASHVVLLPPLILPWFDYAVRPNGQRKDLDDAGRHCVA